MSWTSGQCETITFASGGDNSSNKFKVVEINSAANVVVCNSVFAIGVLQNQPKSGEAATVAIEGFTKALAGVAIYPGQFMVNGSGWCMPMSGGNALATQVVLGRAVTGAASGQQFTLMLDPQLLVTSGGVMP